MSLYFINEFECPICNNYLNVGSTILNNTYLNCFYCKNIRVVIHIKNKNEFFIIKLVDDKNDVYSLSNELNTTVYFGESKIEIEYDQSSFKEASDLEKYYKFIIKAADNMVFA